MKDLVKDVPLFLGRMIAQTALGAGVPVMLLRLDGYPDLPDTEGDQSSPFLFCKACGPRYSFLQDSIDFYEANRFDIFPSGRRYEHPFVTLMRNERPWFCWELGYYKSLIPMLQEVKGLRHFQFPDIFSGLLQFFAEWSSDLNGVLIYGPVPTQAGLGPTTESVDTEDFDLEIQVLMERWSTFETLNKIKAPAGLQNFLSQDRLRRMFHSGGRVIDSQFRSNVLRASQAIQLSCNASFQIDFHDVAVENIRLDLIEDVVSSALLRTRYIRKPNLTFCFPRTGANRIEILSEKGSLLEVAPMRHSTDLIRNSGEIPEDLAFVTATEEYEDDLSDDLRELLVHVDDRNTQSMMHQFMLTRHWLNDRFARLSSMYDDTTDPHSDASRNLKDISKWLIKLFDADFAALYNILPGGALSEMVRSSRTDPLASKTCEENSLHMAFLLNAESGELRRHSICYRAFWHRQSEHVKNWNGKLDGTGMASQDEKGNERPRSSLAAPIMVFGKPWGVIELVGFCPNQFDKVASMWLEEASQLIGNALYQTWLLKQITQANLAVLTETKPAEEEASAERGNKEMIERASMDKERRTLDVRNSICHEMAELFIADGAALWIQNEQWPGLFQLKGFDGVDFPWLRELTERKQFAREYWPEISISEDDSLVAKVMQSQGLPRQLFWEELKPKSNPQNPRDAYQQALWDSGMRYVMIVPLIENVNQGGLDTYKPIGALSIYNMQYGGKKTRNYGQRWVPMMEFAGRHLAMLIRTLALEADRQNVMELMFSHEVIGSLRRVEDQFGYLHKNYLVPAIDTPDMSVSRVAKAPIKDLEKASFRVKNGIEEAVLRLEEMREDGFKMPSARNFDFRSRSPWNKEPTVLYNHIQSAFNARYKQEQRKNMRWKTVGSTDYIRVKVHPIDLSTIFDNLADNARKYGNANTEVLVRIHRSPTGNLFIEFSNEAPRLRPGEQSRLFRRKFRGDRALKTHEDGSGNGLFIARCLANDLGIDLVYADQDIPGRADAVIHKFTVIFGEESVVYGKH